MLLDAALKDSDAADAAGELVYQRIADKHGVDRATLLRNNQGILGPAKVKNIN